jgi:hypothetical protein
MAEQNKRQQLEVHLAAKAKADPDFRDKLLTHPKETIESELGMRFPESLRVTVHEEKVNQLHVVLPIDLQTDDELRLGKRDVGFRISDFG